MIRYNLFYVKFWFLPGFLIKLFCCNFLHDKLQDKIRQRNPKLILDTIIYVYQHVNFMNKGMSIVKKLCVRCDSS